jgi:spore coat protein H
MLESINMIQPFQIKRRGGNIRRLLIALGGFALLVALVWGASLLSRHAEPKSRFVQRMPSDMLFVENKIWNVELEFEKEQYEAMEPNGSATADGTPGNLMFQTPDSKPQALGGPPAGGFGAPPAFNGRGMSGMPGIPGMPAMGGMPMLWGLGGFGQGNGLASAIFQTADSNHDRRLSRQEFITLGKTWFQAWDTTHAGKLNADGIRKGLSKLMPKPTMGFGGPESMMGTQSTQSGDKNGKTGKKKRSDLVDADFRSVNANLTFNDNRISKISVRYKGNSTYVMATNALKHSLKIDLSKGFRGRKLYGVSKLNLNNSIADASWMNEALSYRLYRDAGVPAGRTSYARVYVTVPGKFDRKYLGLYTIVEDVDEDFVAARYGTKRGAIFKPATRKVFEDAGGNWQAYTKTYVPKTPVGETEVKRIIEFSKLVSHASDAEYAAKVGDYLDLDEVSRYMAVTTWLSNMDSLLSMGPNLILYLHPKTNLFQLLPWDLDFSFGQLPLAGGNLDQLSILHPWSGRNRFLERLFKVEEFKRLYLARMKEFNETIFRPERFCQQVDYLAEILRPAIEEESAEKLGRFDQVVAGRSVRGMTSGKPNAPRNPGGDRGGGGFMGMPPFSPPPDPQNARGLQQKPRPGAAGPEGESKPIRTFVAARALSVESQLAGKSEGVQPGSRNGPLSLAGAGVDDPDADWPFGSPERWTAQMMASSFLRAMGAGPEASVTRKQFEDGLGRWFDICDVTHSGILLEEQWRIGVNRMMWGTPMMPSFPGMMGPGTQGMPGQWPAMRP